MCIFIALLVDLPPHLLGLVWLFAVLLGWGCLLTQGGLWRENAPTFSVRTVIFIYGN